MREARLGWVGSQRQVPAPTGRRESRDGEDWVVYTRRMQEPVARVWAAFTEPERVARWLGVCRPTGRSREAELSFSFEGDDLLPLTYRVDHVERRRSLAISMLDPGAAQRWHAEVAFAQDVGGGTVLTLAQTVTSAALAPSTAAGCEYYLDRFVAYVEQRDPGDLDFDEYFLGQVDHYRRMFPVQLRRVR